MDRPAQIAQALLAMALAAGLAGPASAQRPGTAPEPPPPTSLTAPRTTPPPASLSPPISAPVPAPLPPPSPAPFARPATTPVPTPTFPPSPLPAPPGSADDAEPLEVLFIDATLALAQQRQVAVTADGLRLLRRHTLAGVGGVLSIYVAPDEVRWRRWGGPGTPGAPNHRYDLQGAPDPGRTGRAPMSSGENPSAPAARAREMVAWPPASGACDPSPRIGLVDTPVEVSHPLLLGARIETISLLAVGQQATGPAHGTAVASLLVGQRETPALLPQARLLAVGAFVEQRGRTYTTAELLLRAIDRLVLARVSVINLSLGGPPNRWLAQVVAQAQAQGVALVASAGNGGAGAPPTHPAALDGVIAVTAIDLGGRSAPNAPQGAFIDFAAPGVDIPVAQAGAGLAYRSGSSFAAPFLTAMLATGLPLDTLSHTARDLGAAGRDPHFGWGLAQATGECISQPGR